MEENNFIPSDNTSANAGAQTAAPVQTAITQTATQQAIAPAQETKFCKHCGGKIPADAVLCTLCGRQVEQLNGSQAQPQIVINNTNENINTNANINGGAVGRVRNKWVALVLCIFFGIIGGHKFYEGKVGMGILYIFTLGLFGIGVFVDFISILFKPVHYYV